MEYDPEEDSDDEPEQDVAWQGFSECTRWYHSQCVTEDGTNKCKHSLKVFLRTLIALMTDFRLELSQKRLFCRVILIFVLRNVALLFQDSTIKKQACSTLEQHFRRALI